MENGLVTITVKEYTSLVEDSMALQLLEMAGVDNWEGYECMYGRPDIGDYDTVADYKEAVLAFADSY